MILDDGRERERGERKKERRKREREGEREKKEMREREREHVCVQEAGRIREIEDGNDACSPDYGAG